jgi:hypothetical protein
VRHSASPILATFGESLRWWVANYTFSGSATAFLNRDSVFCRNWLFMYGLAGNPDASKIEREQNVSHWKSAPVA